MMNLNSNTSFVLWACTKQKPIWKKNMEEKKKFVIRVVEEGVRDAAFHPPEVPLEFPLPVPVTVRQAAEIEQRQVLEYLEQLDASQRQAYLIAHQHLGSSFNVLRSNGFQEWRRQQPH